MLNNTQLNQESPFSMFHQNNDCFNFADINTHPHHQQILHQNSEHIDNHIKKNKLNALLSPPDNFMVKNILNQSPFNLTLPYQYYNLDKQFEDNEYVAMFKYDQPLLNSLSAKKSTGVSSVATRLDFNDWDNPATKDSELKVNVRLQFQIKNEQSKMLKKRPINKLNRNYEQKSQIKKQLQNEINDDNSSKRNQKGLRNLSQSVRQIVFELKVTTYKDVANKLLQKLQFQNKINLNSTSKDEQNVKRRVYDALNVLISADILCKNGKNVMVKNQSKQKINEKNQIYENEKNRLLQSIKLAQLNLNSKVDKMVSLRQKYESIGNLTCRNKFEMSKSKIERINFPFIGLLFETMSIGEIKEQGRRINLRFKRPFKLIGDIDALIKLQIKCKKYECGLPKQIQEYVKKE